MMAARSVVAGVAGAALVLLVSVAAATPPRGLEAAAAATPTSVHFTAAGDISSSAGASATLNQVGDLAPDAHFALGDLSYGQPGNEQTWCNFVTSRVGTTIPFELISGNHESNGLNGNIDNFAACLPNRLPGLVGDYARQYYVDAPQVDPLVRFIMISPALTYPDGVWSYAAGSPRYQWTADAIDAARAAGIRWVVVGMHKPCLSVGQYGCDPGAALMNLLVTKRVDLVLSGHEHLYARSKQLATGALCSQIVPGTYTAGCVADADNTLVRGAGTVFAIVGTGGTPLRDVISTDSETHYFAASAGKNLNPSFGNLDVSVTPDALTARFQPATGSYTDAFTIAAGPVSTALATDSFTRAVTNGLGTATEGGPWSTTGTASRYSVNGAGRMQLTASGTTANAFLNQVSSTATDLLFTASVDKIATGSGTYVSVTGRNVVGAGAYRAKIVLRNTGQVALSLVRVDSSGGGEVALHGATNLAGLSFTAGDQLRVRLQVTGTNPTTIRAKVWKLGNAEPASWQRSATDATAALQAAGGLGVTLYLSSSATNAPVTGSIDDLLAVAAVN